MNYSRLMAADEEGTLKVLSAHRAVIDGIIEFHEGRIVSTAGDSVLAEFASPVEAVRCAVEVQDALRTRNDSLPEDKRLKFRVGVNLGDVMVKGDDLLGDGVNVAARLESIAEPDGICISASVYDLIRGKLDLGFVDIGEQNLKNIDHPIRVYRIDRDGMPVPKPGPARKASRTTRARWLSGAVGAAIAAGAAAWYLGLLPATPRQADQARTAASEQKAQAEAAAAAEAKRALEEQRLAAELARARAEADEARKRAQAETTAATYAKRALEEQRAAAAKASADAELARAHAEAESVRRKAQAELAAAQQARSAAEREAVARAAESAAAAQPAQAPRTAQETPSPAPAMAAAPAASIQSPPSTAAAGNRYQGKWDASIKCEAWKTMDPFESAFRSRVVNGEFLLARGKRDQPGFIELRGTPGADGTLVLTGRGITGLRAPRPAQPYPARLEGKFEGDRYRGNGTLARRPCVVDISRAQ